MSHVKMLLGRALASTFFIVSVALVLLAGLEFVQAFRAGADKELINDIGEHPTSSCTRPNDDHNGPP